MPFLIIAEAAGHVGAVLAALAVLALLLFVAVIYVKCRLNTLLWYRNHYGELELNGRCLGFGQVWSCQDGLRFGGGREGTLESLRDPDTLGFCRFS